MLVKIIFLLKGLIDATVEEGSVSRESETSLARSCACFQNDTLQEL